MICSTVSDLKTRTEPRCGLKLLVSLSLAVVFAAPPARGQFLYRQLNLAEMTQRAALIVQGRVTAVRHEPLPGYSHIDTVLVTLEVAETLKGAADQNYSFREFVPPGQSRLVHKRTYLPGEQLLLFLSRPSRYGLSGPLGKQQGIFHIKQDSRGNRYIANEAGNFHLFEGVHEAVARAGGVISQQPSQLKSLENRPIPLTKFVSIVKELRNLPGAE